MVYLWCCYRVSPLLQTTEVFLEKAEDILDLNCNNIISPPIKLILSHAYAILFYNDEHKYDEHKLNIFQNRNLQ